MAIRDIDKIKKIVDHPLEDFFNIEQSSTEVVKYERKTELSQYQDFDEKDTENEETFQEIIDLAMTGYDNLQEMIETADTKFAARLAEVSVQHLNVALSAASRKASLKENKDKMLQRAKAGSEKGKTTNNVVFVGDRNDLLRQIQEQMNSGNVIEGEIVKDSDKK